MRENKTSVPKGYFILWLFFAAAYVVWMCFFLRPDTYPREETGILYGWIWPVWIVVSTAVMLMFPVYIAKFLYAPETKASR